MTAAPAGVARRWPRRRVLAALLVVSGLLNLFFIAGAAWTQLNPPARWQGWEQRYQRMAAELDLNDEQRAGFTKYVAAMRARAQKMHEQVDPLMNAVWSDIAKPGADQAAILQQVDEAAAKRREFQREATAQTLDFLALLTPAQRGKFVAIAHDGRSRWHQSQAR